MIYRLLPEGELSLWVANAVRETECPVACPYYDKTWNFVPGQLLELPMWRRYGRLRGARLRGARFFHKLIECEAVKSARQRTALDALQSFLKHFTWQVVRSQYRHVLEVVMHECARHPAVPQGEIAAST